MAGFTGFVDNTNGTNAHENFIDLVEAKANLNGWTTLRKLNTGGVGDARRYELIMQGVGLSGDQEIFIGYRAYQDSTLDYYNIDGAVFTGYLASNTWEAQPGFFDVGCCAHNQRIDYFMNVNAQRIVFCLKVGNPVYEHIYLGRFFQNATPDQYPYPVVAIGSITASMPIRYSLVEASLPSPNLHRMGYLGNSTSSNNALVGLRFVSGSWSQPYVAPWGVGGATLLRDTNNSYALSDLILSGNNSLNPSTVINNIYGWLDGVKHCTGFNLTVEATTTVDVRTYVILQDVNRNAIDSFIALDITP